MGIGLLGPLLVPGNGSLRPRDRTVLAALAVRRGEVMAPDRLADAVWGDQPPSSWPKQVQICVMRLRKALGSAAIETVPGGYRLAVADDDVDVSRFEGLIERGRMLAASGEPERAASTLTRALGLWRGDPYEDVDRWPPGRSEAARLAELHRSAEEDVLEARLAAGEHREVAAEAEARVADEPLRERRWAILALAQYRGGRQADALRSLNRARATLAEQLGIDPGPELVALEAAILCQDPSLVAVAELPALAIDCPYKGLAAYDVDDSECFFGRDADIAACLERLQTRNLLVVAGPSGCGKSSLVRAGLVPALQGRGRTVAILTPGHDPDAALAGALADTAGHPILVVDQLEELFTLQTAADVGRSFCARLAHHATTEAPVIVAVRADHLASLAADPELARLVEHGLHLVSPLAGDNLRAAIEGPATQAGLLLEPGLVDLLVRDSEGEPGALPLLSHALAETWRRRDGRVLTVEGYRASGGIRGAVARSADRLYDSLPAEKRAVLRSVLLRLVAPSQDGEPVRSRVPSRTFSGDPAHQQVVGFLVRARLVTTSEDTVELAHEALARAWPRLRSWLEEDAAGQRILRHLTAAADGWDSLGRPESELYRGARLDGTLEWRNATAPDLTPTEIGFLEASLAAATCEREAVAARAHHQARQNRRLRAALAGVGVLLAVAVVAGAIAISSQRRATREERAAGLRALVSNSLALRTNRRDLAALLAIEAHRLAPSAATEAALFATFTGSPGLERTVRPDGAAPMDFALLDGETMAIAGPEGTVHLVDIDTGVEQGRLDFVTDFDGTMFWLSPSPAGRYLATAAWLGDYWEHRSLLTVWDLQTRQKRFDNVVVPFDVGSVALSADAALVAVGGEDRVQVYDGAIGVLRADVEPIPHPPDAAFIVNTAAVLFAPDGRLIAGSSAGPIRFIDPTTGRELQRIDGERETSELELHMSDDGQSLLTSGFSGLMLYALPSGEPRWRQPAPYDVCAPAGYAERIGVVLCAGDVVVAVDLATGAVLGDRFDTQGFGCDMALSADQATLVELSCTSTEYLVWRLDGGGAASRLAVATTDEHYVTGYYPRAEAIVAEFPTEPGGDPTTHLVATATGEIVDRLPGAGSPVATDNPNVVIALFDDGTAGRYDLTRHARIGPGVDLGFEPSHLTAVGDLVAAWGERQPGTERWAGALRAFDPDTGALTDLTVDVDVHHSIVDVAAIDDSRLVTVECDLEDRCVLQHRNLTSGAPFGARVDAYGQAGVPQIAAAAGTLVVAAADGDVLKLDPSTLEPVGGPFPGVNGVATDIALSADGRRLLVLGADQALHVYDVETRTQLGDAITVDLRDQLASQLGARAGGAILRSDGLEAAVATNQGVVIWDLDPSDWVSAACQLAGRNLTPAEWEQYLGDLAPYHRTCPAFPDS